MDAKLNLWPKSTSEEVFKKIIIKIDAIVESFGVIEKSDEYVKSIHQEDEIALVVEQLVIGCKKLFTDQRKNLQLHLSNLSKPDWVQEKGADFAASQALYYVMSFNKLYDRDPNPMDVTYFNPSKRTFFHDYKLKVAQAELTYERREEAVTQYSHPAHYLVKKCKLEVHSLLDDFLSYVDSLHPEPITSHEVGIEKFCHIYTVLEHEYQSVVRRLDYVKATTAKERRFGFAIVDRKNSAEDLKDTLENEIRPRLGKPLSAGFTSGYIGHHKVLVVCTGNYGKKGDKLFREIKNAIALEGFNKGLYLCESDTIYIVGVCGSTDSELPLGSTLISREKIIEVERKNSNHKWNITRDFVLDDNDDISNYSEKCERLYCFVESKLPPGVAALRGDRFKVVARKFICSPEVVNNTEARNNLLSHLRDEKRLDSSEHVGLEMEGGSLCFGLDRYVVKSISDYADDGKGGWDGKLKNEIQLFAAEMAAESLVHLLAMKD